MKTKLIMGALLSVCFINAQTTEKPATEKKQATVRIKKVENINGVEKVTDTTYTTTDLERIKIEDGMGGKMDGKQMKVIELKSSEIKGELTEEQRKQKIKELTDEMQKFNQERTEKMVEELQKGEKGKTAKTCISRTITIQMDVTDATPEDKKRLASQIGTTNSKLETGNMSMAPNPSSGKFDLNFNLKNKGDAEVTVFNLEGKQVYNEKLPNFTGEYNKSVDLGGNQKGVYFVKIIQGKDSQVKKVILE